jgi:isochorismate synthase EntC
MAAIDRLEGMDRGWYAGPIGWIDGAGYGEFAVALRSGLMTPGQATLFAGAGIVAGSVPEREVAETETKFGALRDAIGG